MFHLQLRLIWNGRKPLARQAEAAAILRRMLMVSLWAFMNGIPWRFF